MILDDCTRRSFLERTAGIALVSAAGIPPIAGKRDRVLNIGFIGFGIRGRNLCRWFLKQPDIRVSGICEISDVRRHHALEMVAAGTGVTSCRGYIDFQELLAQPGLDALVIATPDHGHAEPAISACRAGIHVYCEKPLSLTIKEGRAIADAARRAGITFQTGSQQRSEYGGRFQAAVEHIRNGRVGQLQRVQVGVGDPPVACDLPDEPLPPGLDWNRWLGTAPDRGFNDVLCPIGVHDHYPMWRLYREYGNGLLADMGAHHFDIAQWAMSMDESGPQYIIPPPADEVRGCQLTYANAVEVVHGGPNGCTFEGTDGTLHVDRGILEASSPGILEPPRPGEFHLQRNSGHARNWLSCIRSGSQPICTAETGHRTASVCQLVVIAYELRVPLQWDPAKEHFVGENARKGNVLLSRQKRPWHSLIQ